MQKQINTEFWCERVRKCFKLFLQNPKSIKHLLLYGPPGSGKTTSAEWLVSNLWEKDKIFMSITMNASDERSLEAIRQKIIPFINGEWRPKQDDRPRFIILDECETLTDAAQLSLQTILDRNDICMILICNSQSRIHPKLRQRLLKIRFDPPDINMNNQVMDAFSELTRNDFRCLKTKQMTEEFIWNIFNSHNDNINNLIHHAQIDTFTLLTYIILIAEHLQIMDDELVRKINLIYNLNNHETNQCSNILFNVIMNIRKKLIQPVSI